MTLLPASLSLADESAATAASAPVSSRLAKPAARQQIRKTSESSHLHSATRHDNNNKHTTMYNDFITQHSNVQRSKDKKV